MKAEEIRKIPMSNSADHLRDYLLREGIAQLAELNENFNKLMNRSIFEQTFGKL